MMKENLLFFLLLFGFAYIPRALACDDSTTSLISYTEDVGTYTILIEVCNEMLGTEGIPDDFSMTFEGASDLNSFLPATVSTSAGDNYNGSISGNVLNYSLTSTFASHNSLLMCHTYTVTTSEPVSRVIVATHLGRSEADCSNRLVCIATTTPVLESVILDSEHGAFDLTTLQDPNYPNGTWSGVNVSGNTFETSDVGEYELIFTPNGEECVNAATTTIEVTQQLSIDLTQFEATSHENCETTLEWTTHSETNHAYFEIEQSKDGVSFYAIAQKNTQGNSHQIQQYNYLLTPKALNNGAYFRLKQVDKNDRWSYSDVIEVEKANCIHEVNIVAAYPNPVRNQLILDVEATEEGTVTVVVYNLMGQVVREKSTNLSLGFNELALQTDDWMSGLYWIQVVKNNRALDMKKVVKQ